MVQPSGSISGHNSDILSLAKMSGSPLIATSDYDGHICTWNVESGVSRRQFLPPHHKKRPEAERAVEKVIFLSGRSTPCALIHKLLANQCTFLYMCLLAKNKKQDKPVYSAFQQGCCFTLIRSLALKTK